MPAFVFFFSRQALPIVTESGPRLAMHVRDTTHIIERASQVGRSGLGRPHRRAILLDARPLVCQSPRASPSRRVSQCAEGCSISSWLAYCSELLHVFFMGLFLAFRDDAHANSHDCARRMCTSDFQRVRTRTAASGGWCT